MDRVQRSELCRILGEHAGRYPLMEPADAVKLLYQSEFGGGHLIADREKSLERLREEYDSVSGHGQTAPAEELGGGMVRIMLAGIEDQGGLLEQLNRDFMRSAQLCTGSMEQFLNKLEVLRSLARAGTFRFSAGELGEYLKAYMASGCPPVSHSEAYRAAYRPAYRVMLCTSALCLMLREIFGLQKRRKCVLAALDGRCAAGKTTLARQLHDRYGWSVIHMDHFFLRPEQQTEQRYDTPGENVDHERFLEEVLLPLREGRTVEYRPFDCRTQQLAQPVRVPASPVVLIEGSYACHESLWEQYDLRAFLTVDPEEQLRRIVARNGAENAPIFREKWIPLEERYIVAYEPEKRCDFCLRL